MVLQGRGDWNQWVTSFSIEYTLDGLNWIKYKRGENFSGVSDRYTKRFLKLDPFYAVSIKIIARAYYGVPAMRIGAFFIMEE